MYLQQRLRFALTLTFRSLSQSSSVQTSEKVKISKEKSPTKISNDKSAKKVSKENNSDKISKEKNPAKIPKDKSAKKVTKKNNSDKISKENAPEDSLKEKVSENVSNEKSSEKDRAIAFINTLPRCPLCGGFLGYSSLETHLRHNHSKMINLKLREEPHKTYSKIFGDKNIKTMSDDQIRWYIEQSNLQMEFPDLTTYIEKIFTPYRFLDLNGDFLTKKQQISFAANLKI